jgi:protein-S-isoprenylcysteine O-methyltransferase Ste14
MAALFRGLRTLVYLTCFVLFWGWLGFGARKYDPRIGVSIPRILQPLGVVAMIAGGALGLTCIANFVLRGRGTPVPFDPPKELVAAGPYKYVRNPMYVGALTMGVGFGLWLRSVSILLLALLVALIVHLFVVLLEEPDLERRFGASYISYKKRFVVLLEEPDLERRFGASYISYKKRVNRWLPRWPRPATR